MERMSLFASNRWLASAALALLLANPSNGFLVLPQTTCPASSLAPLQRRRHRSFSAANKDEIVDAEFEKKIDPNSGGSSNKKKKSRTASAVNDDDDDDEENKSLLDLMLDADPQWKTKRIPFCRGEEYIDAKLALVVELEGVQYGIAVPFDDPVAILIESASKKGGESGVEYVYPDKYDDNEEYAELMEIMAARVRSELGEELTLRKTPKVLTISGGLGRITDKWEKKVLGEPVPIEELLKTISTDEKSMDGEVADFMDFMRRELGDEEFEKTMNEDPSEEDKELMKYFNIPGFGDNKDHVSGLDELVKSMEKDLDKNDGVWAEAKKFQPPMEGLSLKIIAFDLPASGKTYSLVKLLEPYVLVGRLLPVDTSSDIDEFSGDIRFELLSLDEEEVLVPKLEDVCKEDLSVAVQSIGD